MIDTQSEDAREQQASCAGATAPTDAHHMLRVEALRIACDQLSETYGHGQVALAAVYARFLIDGY